MALHYFKGACQISRILPMYVSHLLHLYTSYLLWLKEKDCTREESDTSCDRNFKGWVLIGLQLFVTTSELPNFRNNNNNNHHHHHHNHNHNHNHNQNHHSKDKIKKDADSKPPRTLTQTQQTQHQHRGLVPKFITGFAKYNNVYNIRLHLFIVISFSISISIYSIFIIYTSIFDIYNFTKSSPFPSTTFPISPPCHVSGLHGPCGVVHGRVHGLAGDLKGFWREVSLNDIILYHLVSPCTLSNVRNTKTKAS